MNDDRVPTYDDITADIHIGDVYPAVADDLPPARLDEVASASHPSPVDGAIRSAARRRGRRRREEDVDGADDDGRRVCDPSVAHVRTGSIVMPVEMTVPSAESVKEGNGVETAPSYSIGSPSRVSIYVSFPPPPIVLQPKEIAHGGLVYDETTLSNARRRLRQYSGFHGAVGVTSASKHAEGYADAMLSLNYQLPSLLSLPSPLALWRLKAQQFAIANMHCNLLLGSTTKPSLGTTLSSLDGRTHIRWDVGNPLQLFEHQSEADGDRSGILVPSSRSNHTISASRAFSLASTPLRLNWTANVAPLPPLVLQPTNTMSGESLRPLQLRHFNVTLSTREPGDESDWPSGKPKVSLSLGYGAPLPGGEWRWTSLPRIGMGVDLCDRGSNVDRANVPAWNTANLKLDVEQSLSTSQSCRSTLEYSHAGQVLSLGTMAVRTFTSSMFSRLGVGVRYTLGNLFNKGSWWKSGDTSWLFQLERGDVRFLVPITIFPRASNAWDSLLRLAYASFVSLAVDALVGESLCGDRSRLRLAFLRLVLGKEKVSESASPAVDGTGGKQENEEEWLQHNLEKARTDASRQINLMLRQARAVTSKEKEQGGLVIVKAVYGVIDNESRQWVRRKGSGPADGDGANTHTMDATTQLQFWVTDSSLHLPAVSKAHMLGFYDVLACVNDDEWLIPQSQSSEQDERGSASFLCQTLGKLWKAKLGSVEEERDLAVVLSVRYKWADTIYDVMFFDEEAVDLPSRFAEKVKSL